MIRIQPRSVRVRLTFWYVGVMLVVLGVYAGGGLHRSFVTILPQLSRRTPARRFRLGLRHAGAAARWIDCAIRRNRRRRQPVAAGVQPDGQFCMKRPKPVAILFRRPINSRRSRRADSHRADGRSAVRAYRVMSGGARIGGRPVDRSGRALGRPDHPGSTSIALHVAARLADRRSLRPVSAAMSLPAAHSRRSIGWPNARVRSTPSD